MDKPYSEWTRQDWHANRSKAAMIFKKQYGKMPVRSKKCCGCPSWPLVLCGPCHTENHGERRKTNRGVLYTSDQRLGKKY